MKVYNNDEINVGDKIIVERTLNDEDGDYQTKEYYIAKQGADGMYLKSSSGEVVNDDVWSLVLIYSDYLCKVDEFPSYVNELFGKF